MTHLIQTFNATKRQRAAFERILGDIARDGFMREAQLNEIVKHVNNMAAANGQSPQGAGGDPVPSLNAARAAKAKKRADEARALAKGIQIGYEKFAENLLPKIAFVQDMAVERAIA